MSDNPTLWLQITSGRGPAECQIAVARIAPLVVTEANAMELAAEIIGGEEGAGRGMLLSALVKVTGAGTVAFADRWRGSVQWICRSPVRPTHKRKNWFVGIDVLTPPAELGSSRILSRDVTFEAMRASGPGGQHVNKTESAVRATHTPTGLTVVAREERSQAMNRKLALARLAAAIAGQQRSAAAASDRSLWTQHDQLARGNPVRTFKGEEFREERH